MKGRCVGKNSPEQQWMDKARDLGCIVCINNGHTTPYSVPFECVAIHHITGKTAPFAHFNTIGLCPEHHQNTGYAIHYNKARFEAKNGKQEELLMQVQEILGAEIVGIQRKTKIKKLGEICL